jgi:hypothetical protein
MTECETHRELLGGYVLGALEAEEAETVRAHLESCPECAAEHARLAGLPALLDMAAGLEPSGEGLPPSVEERLLDRYARDRRRRGRGGRGWLGRVLPSVRARPRAAIAVACAIVLAGAAAFALLGGGEERRGYDLPLRGAKGAPNASATATLWRTAGGTGVELTVRNLPRDPGVVYELLCERLDGGRASAGTFRVGRDGRAVVRLTTAARIGEYDRLRVVRRAGGLSEAKQSADVLMGLTRRGREKIRRMS